MKKILFFLFFFGFSNMAHSFCPALVANGLSDQQIVLLHKAFVTGLQRDMEYSLSAIAWQESSAGRYLINLQDPSSGVFHITVENALIFMKWKDTPFNRNRIAQLLINDFKLSSQLAMNNLDFWKNLYGENWHKIWASYNAGYDWRKGIHYSNQIAHKIELIKMCGWGVDNQYAVK